MAREAMADFTEASEALFRELAADAVNWNGEPLLGGNVRMDAKLRGNVTHLKKLGLITTFVDEGDTWVIFADSGKSAASDFGITIRCWNDQEATL